MKNKVNVGIIGGGNMGSAIYSGIKDAYSVNVCEADARARARLKKNHRLKCVDLEELMKGSRIIILAVKPQTFDAVLKELNQYTTKQHVFISIAAGITTKYIEKRLPKARVVRTMPNLGVQIGVGMTGLSKGRYATASDLSKAKSIFNQVGETITVPENKLDAITAVSGSGPAYVFHFIEAFIAAAKQLGLTQKEVSELVSVTVYGSVMMMNETSESAADLRKKVTSKGGTTHAALKEFEKGKYMSLFSKALKAAKKRSKELSK